MSLRLCVCSASSLCCLRFELVCASPVFARRHPPTFTMFCAYSMSAQQRLCHSRIFSSSRASTIHWFVLFCSVAAPQTPLSPTRSTP
ncbi:hypothetical protein SESBI_39129 [Sesbania bispinosa]|nr:hypothetical protein SESBI_39129 [Sesbania bispinosa]